MLSARWAEVFFQAAVGISLCQLLHELGHCPLAIPVKWDWLVVLGQELASFVVLHILLFGFNSFDQAAHIAHRQPVRTDLLFGRVRAPGPATALFAAQFIAALVLAAVWRKQALTTAEVGDKPGLQRKKQLLAFVLLSSCVVQAGLSPWGSIATNDLELGAGASWEVLGAGGPRAVVYSLGAVWYVVLDWLGSLGMLGARSSLTLLGTHQT